MTPCRGNTIFFCSSQQLLVSDPQNAFCPSRALLPHALPPELQRNGDAVKCAMVGAEVPGHFQEQLTKT